MSVLDSRPTDEELPERVLVEAAKAGDRVALRQLYQRHAPAVFRVLLAMLHDRTLAEDLLADTFVKAMEHLPRFEWQGKGLRPWLTRIGKNLALDYLRRAKRYKVSSSTFELESDKESLDLESMVHHSELSGLLGGRIDHCMDEINPRYRKVLELRLVKKMDRGEAAKEMEVSVGTLDVLLYRACRAFRKVYLNQYGEQLGDESMGSSSATPVQEA